VLGKGATGLVGSGQRAQGAPMTILRMTPEDEATGLTAEIYQDEIETLGYVPH
jgi:hypothetical protein